MSAVLDDDMSEDPLDVTFLHDGRPISLRDTTIETLGSMLGCRELSTELRLSYVNSVLFTSSAPPGEEPPGRVLIPWEEVVYCACGRQHRYHLNGNGSCSCRVPTPPATEAVVAAFVRIVDAIVAARDAFDWSIQPEGEQNLEEGQQPNESLVGELLAEIEFTWTVVLKRVPGAVGPLACIAGPPPAWWANGGEALARRSTHAWVEALKGRGAKGQKPIGIPDASDDVFNHPLWLLQYERVLAMPDDAGPMNTDLHFDDDGVLRWSVVGQRIAEGSSSSDVPMASVARPDPPPEEPAALAVVAEGVLFATGQHVSIHGLQGRADLNGQLAEVRGPLTSERYPVKVLAAEGASVRVRPSNLARTGDSPQEGKCVEGRVMVFGEWFPMQALLDRMMNDGKAAGDAFKALAKRAQADVLAGRTTLGMPLDPSLPNGCPRREWLGSGGAMCDGCGETRAQLWRQTWAGEEAAEDEEPPSDDDAIEIDVCPRCKYTACENCQVHHSRGTCYCKDANFGRAYPPQSERQWYHGGYW